VNTKTKTININDLEGFGIVDDLSFLTNAGATKDDLEKLDRKINTLDGLCATYYSQMNKLSKYIEESQDYVNKCVRESLKNQAMLQSCIEYEIFLCQLEVDIARAQVIAIIDLPWYKRNKKNKDRVMKEVDTYFHEKAQDRIKELQEKMKCNMKNS